MFRSLKRRGIALRVTESGTEADAITKQVRHLPRCRSTQEPSAAYRLAHLKRIRFVDSEISTSLQVETRIAERFNARTIDEHIPPIEFLRRSDQGEGSVSQLRRTTLRVRDEERRPRLTRRDIYSRSDVAIKLSGPSRYRRRARTHCCS